MVTDQPLPPGWRVARLEEAATVASGGNAPQGSQYFADGKYPFARVKHFDGASDYISEFDLIKTRLFETTS